MEGSKQMYKTRIALCVCVIIATSLSQIARAELYRYVDRNGKIHYTDDLSKLPPDLVPKAKEIEEVGVPKTKDTNLDQSATEPEQTPELKSSGKDALPSPDAQDSAQKSAIDNKAFEQTLQTRRNALDTEYQELTAKRAALEQSIKASGSSYERTQLNERVTELNVLITDHIKKKEAFNREVEAYNKSLGANTKP